MVVFDEFHRRDIRRVASGYLPARGAAEVRPAAVT